MTEDTEDRPPFDPERLDRLRDIAEEQWSISSANNRRLLELQKAREKREVALINLRRPDARRNDAAVEAAKRQLDEAKRQLAKHSEQASVRASQFGPHKELLEACEKYAKQHGWRPGGLGFFSKPQADLQDSRHD